jgi:hypothetical protein
MKLNNKRKNFNRDKIKLFDKNGEFLSRLKFSIVPLITCILSIFACQIKASALRYVVFFLLIGTNCYFIRAYDRKKQNGEKKELRVLTSQTIELEKTRGKDKLVEDEYFPMQGDKILASSISNQDFSNTKPLTRVKKINR